MTTGFPGFAVSGWAGRCSSDGTAGAARAESWRNRRRVNARPIVVGQPRNRHSSSSCGLDADACRTQHWASFHAFHSRVGTGARPGLRGSAGPVAAQPAAGRSARRRDVPRIDRGPGHQVRIGAARQSRRGRQPETQGRHDSPRARRPRRISAVGAAGPRHSSRVADARVLGDQPAGAADQPGQSTRALLQRPRRPRVCPQRRDSRSRRAGRHRGHRLLHAGAEDGGHAAVSTRHHLPRLPSERRHAWRAGPADVQHDAGVRRPSVEVGHHGSPDAAQGTLGRLVRHRQQRRGRPHRQQRARARRPARAASSPRRADYSSRKASAPRRATSPR